MPDAERPARQSCSGDRREAHERQGRCHRGAFGRGGVRFCHRSAGNLRLHDDARLFQGHMSRRHRHPEQETQRPLLRTPRACDPLYVLYRGTGAGTHGAFGLPVHGGDDGQNGLPEGTQGTDHRQGFQSGHEGDPGRGSHARPAAGRRERLVRPLCPQESL